MKLPLSLIKTYLDFSESPQTISHLLTLAGIEVEKIHGITPTFGGVIVGKILSISPHPNNKKLQIAKVSDGKETFTIVSGAPNCRKEMKTAFAKVGSWLLDKTAKKYKVQKKEIDQIASYGMLCSGKELQISEEDSGILDLPDTFQEGTDLATLLYDPVFEISLTPNLGHCFSALGIARELSAILDIPLKKKSPSPLLENVASPIEKIIRVENHCKEKCRRYCCRIIQNIQMVPTPFWIQKILESCGLRSINVIVDIVNFIMLECGQPMHAFDFDAIEDHRLMISSNTETRSFVALDEKEYLIPKETIVISDPKKILAIGGIVGGLSSSVGEKTKNILLEAAVFDPISIRKISNALTLRTESSIRFEKGIDIVAISDALEHASELIQKICQGSVSKGRIDIYEDRFKPISVPCRLKKIEDFLGLKLSMTEVETIFRRLHLESTAAKDEESLYVTIPPFRNDLKAEIDLIEEIARIYGYNNIPKPVPFFHESNLRSCTLFQLEEILRHSLLSEGISEIITCDLISSQLMDICSDSIFSKDATIKVLYSRSEDHSILRPSLLPSFLQTAKFNTDHKNLYFRGFEIARVHWKEQDHEIEAPVFGIVLFGPSHPYHWKTKPQSIDFFDMKGMIENLLRKLNISNYHFLASSSALFHSGRQAELYIKEQKSGIFGEIHPQLLQKADIKVPLYFGEFFTNSFLKSIPKVIQYKKIPIYPSVERDWTITLSKKNSYDEIIQKIRSCAPPLLENLLLLDIYEDPSIGKDNQNITIRFFYRDPEATLTLEKVEREHQQLITKASSLLAN